MAVGGCDGGMATLVGFGRWMFNAPLRNPTSLPTSLAGTVRPLSAMRIGARQGGGSIQSQTPGECSGRGAPPPRLALGRGQRLCAMRLPLCNKRRTNWKRAIWPPPRRCRHRAQAPLLARSTVRSAGPRSEASRFSRPCWPIQRPPCVPPPKWMCRSCIGQEPPGQRRSSLSKDKPELIAQNSFYGSLDRSCLGTG